MRSKNIILRMCEISMVSALSFVLGRLTLSFDNLKITFAAFPILLLACISSYWGDAAIASFVAQFLSQMLTYGLSMTTVLWIFPSVFRAVVFWFLVHKILKNNLHKVSYYVGADVIAVSVTVLNTLVIALDAIIFGYYTPTYVYGMFFIRLGSGIISMMLMSCVVALVASRVKVKNIR